ncbi:Uncharacterised protein [Chlamydia trachomatis]|nr:Uncharacterised protein [Chlamydia trachomatis]
MHMHARTPRALKLTPGRTLALIGPSKSDATTTRQATKESTIPLTITTHIILEALKANGRASAHKAISTAKAANTIMIIPRSCKINIEPEEK